MLFPKSPLLQSALAFSASATAFKTFPKIFQNIDTTCNAVPKISPTSASDSLALGALELELDDFKEDSDLAFLDAALPMAFTASAPTFWR
ncbi:hypothetical protein BT96DRAFT_991621 [Gymnopus androsaceus JB14]|uniref:Uncharacterized protein n=1 Tax=Gymnopus androsaceus JB14 TaxID=1447944 RepID=A0A6A4HYX9_9AGAR|nr:hypothetical protein BT96DRAFT_991621 [Gymnopus androsaceus JB14]